MNLTTSAYDYNWDSIGNSLDDVSGYAAIFGAFMIFIIIGIAVYIFVAIAWWKLFVKAGKPGWAALIPVYSTWVMLEIVGLPGWISLFTLLSFVPVLNYLTGIFAIVLNIIIAIKIAPLFGKETSFAVGLIFLPYIFYPILAFSKNSVFVGESVVSEVPIEPESPIKEE